jgi:hypothetical protein
LPPLPGASPTPSTLPTLRGYLGALAEADAAYARAAEGCRVLDRARALMPDLVTAPPEARRAVRETAATSAARLNDARVALAPKMADLLLAGGPEIPNPWRPLAEQTSATLRERLRACSDAANACDAPTDVAVCDKIAASTAAPHKVFETALVESELHPYVGGRAWCASPTGQAICADVQARFIEHGETVLRDACRDVYLTGEGPDLVRVARKRNEADVDRALTLIGALVGAGRAAGASSERQHPRCRTVHTCTCEHDGRQMTLQDDCPRIGEFSCASFWMDEQHEECN